MYVSDGRVWVALFGLSLSLLGLWAHFVDPLDVIAAFVEDSDDHAHVYDWFGLRKSLVMRCLWLVAVVGMKEGSLLRLSIVCVCCGGSLVGCEKVM